MQLKVKLKWNNCNLCKIGVNFDNCSPIKEFCTVYKLEINKSTLTWKKNSWNLLRVQLQFINCYKINQFHRNFFSSTNFNERINSALFCLFSGWKENMHSHLSFSRQTEYNEKGRHRRRLIVDAMNGDGLVTFYYILALICKTKIRGVEFTKKIRENT